MVNELTDDDRAMLMSNIKSAAKPTLIIEPISHRISPWWNDWAAEFLARGGRADEWRARIDAPPIVKRLAKAAGLRPEVLTARSLFAP